MKKRKGLTITRISHVAFNPFAIHDPCSFVAADGLVAKEFPVVFQITFEAVTKRHHKEEVRVHARFPLDQFMVRAVMNFICESYLLVEESGET